MRVPTIPALILLLSPPACSNPPDLSPELGGLEVTSLTTGRGLDPDGYTITLAGSETKRLGPNDLLTYPGLGAGTYELRVGGLAANCALDGPNPRRFTVTAGSTTRVELAVNCSDTGILVVRGSSGGLPFDPDGYRVTVDGQGEQVLDRNGEVRFALLTPGSYRVSVSDIAINCYLLDNSSTTASVSAGQTTVIVFQVNCVPPEALVILLDRSCFWCVVFGIPDTQSFTAMLQVDDLPPQWTSGPGVLVLQPIPPGNHTVQATMEDCYLFSGGQSSSEIVRVPAGGIGIARFTFDCDPP